MEFEYTAQVPVVNVEQGYNQFGFARRDLTLPNFYPQIRRMTTKGWNISLGPGYGDAVFSDTALYQSHYCAVEQWWRFGNLQPCEGFAACASLDVALRQRPMRDFMIA